MIFFPYQEIMEENLMVHYRRDMTQGGTYFFTLALKDRSCDLLIKYIKLLGHSFRRARKNNPYTTKAIVVLLEHLHVIWELPEGDDNYTTRLRQIKTYFLREVLAMGEPLFKNQRNEYNLWQRGFWEHRIRDETDFFIMLIIFIYIDKFHQKENDSGSFPY